jgi:hypothetical protein
MTDYAKMTDEELRIEIAKAKGWREFIVPPDYNHENGGNVIYVPPTITEHDLVYALPNIGKVAQFYFCRNWSTDMAAAWGLVEEASCVKVGFSLANMQYVETKRIVYEAIFYDEWGGPITEKFIAIAPTAPRAICLAWLAWQDGTK